MIKKCVYTAVLTQIDVSLAQSRVSKNSEIRNDLVRLIGGLHKMTSGWYAQSGMGGRADALIVTQDLGTSHSSKQHYANYRLLAA